MTHDRLNRVVDLAYEQLRQKVNGGRMRVDNEVSLQLQLGSILKSVGELFEIRRSEFFEIELEKQVMSMDGPFGKSGSARAKIDIFCSFVDVETDQRDCCAIELKYFKRQNHREPNNRYDVYRDIANLEQYGCVAKTCYLIIATDHDHYVSQECYSPDTADFDFRHGKGYVKGTSAEYRTKVPYGTPILLNRSYEFHWDAVAGGYHFMKLAVRPV